MAKQVVAATWRESASLIMLARDKMLPQKNPFDYNVLLFTRAQNASYMPNSSVFPGGVCESADESPLWLKYFQSFGVQQQSLLNLLGPNGQSRPSIYAPHGEGCLEKAISLRITAIRETFEEVGVILCRNKNNIDDPNPYAQLNDDFDRAHWQHLVHNDASQFLNLCKELKVVPDLWRLHEWSAWLSPATKPKRFQTAFFVVALEEKPDIILEQNEAMDCSWKSPLEYLTSYQNKDIWLPPPQFYELSRLLNFSEIEKLTAFAKERAVHGATLLLPVNFKCKDGTVSLLPGDDVYPSDPNCTTKFIETGVTMEEFRAKSKNLHRAEFVKMNDAVLYLNFSLEDRQIAPLNLNSRSKL